MKVLLLLFVLFCGIYGDICGIFEIDGLNKNGTSIVRRTCATVDSKRCVQLICRIRHMPGVRSVKVIPF